MSMILEVNGSPYDNFLSGEVDIRLDSLCNTFHFVLARSQDSALPFNVGDTCKVKVNNILVLTGHIEALSVAYDSTTHSIEIAGRDKTSDLLDSSINEMDDIENKPTLKAIIERVIENIQSDLQVVEGSNIDEMFDEEFGFDSVSAPEPGTNCFSFLEPLAKQKQVLLSSNADGNVLLTQGSTEKLGNAKLQNAFNSSDNNILSGNVSYDNTQRYRIYGFINEKNPSALGDDGTTDLDAIVTVRGGTIDASIRIGRQLILNTEEQMDGEETFNRSQWEANIRKVRGQLYTVTTNGYAYDGVKEGSNIWEINKLVSVVDVFANVDGELLINDIHFRLSEKEGEITRIGLVPSNAYTLALDEIFVSMNDEFS